MKDIVGVVGAGVMGKGVAHRFAREGCQVVLYDADAKVLREALSGIEKDARYMSMFQKMNTKEMIGRISLADSWDDFSKVAVVVENVTEEVGIKKNVYEKLDAVCPPGCVFLANTSCVPISKLGSFTSRPEAVIGVHFMNPVPMKNFAEVIKGWLTSEETVTRVAAILSDVHIDCEIIRDSAGFVSNRLSHLLMNEAAFLVYEGIASAVQIDNVCKKAFGYPMGPLETADLIGIDTVCDSLKVLYEEYEDPKFRTCPLLKRMLDTQRTGRKSGKGFYEYS